MWEGLARTQRQDRALHGAAKAVNVVVGLIAIPVWLIGQLFGGALRDLLRRFELRSKRALRVPPERPRTMDSLMEELRSLKHHLRPNPLAEVRRGLADVSPFV